MSNNQKKTKIFKMASGDIIVWVDGGIHLKINVSGTDPVELGELLVRLAIEQRG